MGFLVDMACEEVAEEAEPGQDCEDGREVDLDGAGEVRGRSALRCQLERPSRSGGDGDQVKEVDPACGWVMRDRGDPTAVQLDLGAPSMGAAATPLPDREGAVST